MAIGQDSLDFSLLIGGQAGQGSRKAGQIIAQLFNYLGYEIYIYNDYPSLIRGGHNFSQIRASQEEKMTHQQIIDILLALDITTLEKHHSKVVPHGLIFYNQDKITDKQLSELKLDEEKKLKLIGLSLKAYDDSAPAIMANTALIAALAKALGIELEILTAVIEQEIEAKTEENLALAKTVYKKTETIHGIQDLNEGSRQPAAELRTGNETLSLGAAAAGLDLYLAYPMTPATGILHFLAQHPETGVKAVQLENELSVANAAVGAAYAGAKTMLGSSGGGFALMTEALSLAVQNETPVVFVESQRAGPASGVPTYTQQSDLSFALSAGHGDITKFVIAPGDANEAYQWAGRALQLAWQYQTPVILLIDKQVSESVFSFKTDGQESIAPADYKTWDQKNHYGRYKMTEDGISPLAFPGQTGAVVKTNSYEHDEAGLTTEIPEQITAMQDKRARKFEQMKQTVTELPAVKIAGQTKAEKAIITWGSNKGAVIEAAEKLELKVIQPIVLEPFPEKQIKQALQNVKKVALVELNQQAQLGQVLAQYGVGIDKEILKYDGRPFVPSEIEQALTNF